VPFSHGVKRLTSKVAGEGHKIHQGGILVGAICNPKAPAAAEARFTQYNFMINLIVNAVALVLPDPTPSTILWPTPATTR
jgi:hypothetical protein